MIVRQLAEKASVPVALHLGPWYRLGCSDAMFTSWLDIGYV